MGALSDIRLPTHLDIRATQRSNPGPALFVITLRLSVLLSVRNHRNHSKCPTWKRTNGSVMRTSKSHHLLVLADGRNKLYGEARSTARCSLTSCQSQNLLRSELLLSRQLAKGLLMVLEDLGRNRQTCATLVLTPYINRDY
jgi:hypothetical protein